jgi:hypothetical protein
MDQYGRPKGQTLIRQAKVKCGWDAMKSVELASDMGPAEMSKLRAKETVERHENFDIFDKTKTGALTPSELQVCMLARGSPPYYTHTRYTHTLYCRCAC